MNRAAAKQLTMESMDRGTFNAHQLNLRIHQPRFSLVRVAYAVKPLTGQTIRGLDLRFRLFRSGYTLIYKHGYILCVATTMKYQGESWLRSRDLRDGHPVRLPLILWDIFCYEFKIGRFRK